MYYVCNGPVKYIFIFIFYNCDQRKYFIIYKKHVICSIFLILVVIVMIVIAYANNICVVTDKGSEA